MEAACGRERTPGNEHGNAMVKFDGGPKGSGSVGNAQFPIVYALSAARHGYAMFFDDPYAEHWSFTSDPLQLHTLGDSPIGRLHVDGGLGFRAIAKPFIVGYVDIGYGGEGIAIFSGINYPF